MTAPIEDQLDEILDKVWAAGYDYAELTSDKYTLEDLRNANINDREILPSAKTDLLNLFAHLASEAKPERQDEHPMEDGVPVEVYGYEATHNQAIDTYHNNILKALGRGK